MSYESIITDHINHIYERITRAALLTGRDPEAIQLVAVSKTFPPEAIVTAYHAGLRHFGENRPEEGAEKIPLVLKQLTDIQRTLHKPTWHMIGHIQRRKAQLVIAHFDYVHSVDRLAIANRLSTLAQQAGRTIPVLLECNISGEASKFGYAVTGWEQDVGVKQHFIDEVKALLAMPGLIVQGLMTMAPLVDDAEDVRPIFVSLRALRDVLCEVFSDTNFPHLSMGMSSDYEVAVEEGATMVRIGRAIFGERTF
jgi:pyridoxal phosphate enzyme (YggS family)